MRGLVLDVKRIASRCLPFIATADEVFSSDPTPVTFGLVRVILPGETMVSPEEYTRIKGFRIDPPRPVLMVPVGDTYIVLGEIQSGPPTPFVIEGDNLGFNTGLFINTGFGSPEGVVYAEGGSIYLNAFGATQPVLWVKKSPISVATGWVPAGGDRLTTSGSAPAFTALTALGTTGSTAGSMGNDTSGQIQVMPGGTGIASGSFITITFATARPDANYDVWFSYQSTAARAIAGNIGIVSRFTTGFSIQSPIALNTGGTYFFGYLVVAR